MNLQLRGSELIWHCTLLSIHDLMRCVDLACLDKIRSSRELLVQDSKLERSNEVKT